MGKKVINNMVLDTAEIVSYNEETAQEYLTSNEVAINDYVTRGFELLNSKFPKEEMKLSKSQSFFRRAVLAAKIAHEYCNEPTFGSVKFQKMVYLSEQISEMKFVSNYRKQAAGPMDHKFIHSIKKEFEKQKWFEVKQEGEYRKWVFYPLENMPAYEQYYQNYFGNTNTDIQFLIDSFRKWKTDDVELVATLFACWLEVNEENSLINDQVLIKKIYGWHKAKEKFTESDISKGIRWMEENGVYPH